MTLRGRHLLLLDVISIVVSFFASFALRFDPPSPLFDEYLGRFWWVVLVLLPARVSFLFGLRLYQRVWRYASVGELQSIVFAIAGSSFVAYGVVYAAGALYTPFAGFPRSIPFIETGMAVIFVGASRFWFRVARIGRRSGATITGAERTLIVGAGSAGAAVAAQLSQDRALGLHPVGFVDDDVPRGQRILGIPVLGRIDDLDHAVEQRGIGTVLLALPSAEGKLIRRIVRKCEALKVRALTVPSLAELVSGRVSPVAVRDVQVEDLLRRAPARIDMAVVRETVAGTTVLITGAGGSIGSELARQVQAFGPGHVFLLGHGENSIFEICHELDEPERTTPVIMDVRDEERVDRFIRSVHPNVVFHAAAHKHVPLMERFPEEAVATNVFGTENVLRSCERAGVRRFVLISTDKAVNPTSVMGATKRVAELLVQRAALRTGRPYVAVRFGNVLSSRGSVVPLFRRQLERGGPLTITHEEASRYFMTIPEAVQLVFQAAALGDGGEIFVLDMGEPVKIVDLARQLAELHDVELGVDIPVAFIGLRPGEKLHEQLFFEEETPQRTAHQNIFVARSEVASDLTEGLAALRGMEARGGEGLRQALRELVPQYSAEPIGVTATRAADER